MKADQLREHVYRLSERLSWLGMTPDIPAMTPDELEGAYRLLLRLSDG